MNIHLRPHRPPRPQSDTRRTSFGREVIRDPRRVDRIMRGLFSLSARARVLPLGPEPAAASFARAATLQPGNTLPMGWAAEPPFPTPPFEIQTFGFNSGFAFRVEHAEPRGELLHVGVPKAVVRVRGQRHRRVEATFGTRVSIPAFNVHERDVRDLSFEGLSFLAAPGDRMETGLGIPLVILTWPGGIETRFDAQVRHLSRIRPSEPEVCGLKLHPKSVEDHLCWMEMISRRLYPNTVAGTHLHDELWDLFEESGYFHIGGRSSTAFDQLKKDFSSAASRLAAAPTVGCQVSWPSASRLEGAVTLIKPYSGTWLGYQLARRRDGVPPVPGKQILREVLLHGYEYPQRDPDFSWMITWVRTDGRFSRLLMHDLTSRFIHEEERAALVRFRALHSPTDRRPVHPTGGLELGVATLAEIDRLLRVVDRTRPRAYTEALDLVSQRFALTGIKAAWHDAGLERDRRVLVARRDGAPLAAAVCELVEDGLHLFGLFDLVRLFPLMPGGEVAFGVLLESARSWYRSRGKLSCAYFCEHKDFRFALESGFEDLGSADMTILSAALMPDQLEHAWEITAPSLEVS